MRLLLAYVITKALGATVTLDSNDARHAFAGGGTGRVAARARGAARARLRRAPRRRRAFGGRQHRRRLREALRAASNHERDAGCGMRAHAPRHLSQGAFDDALGRRVA